jgi:hypothetical protein
MEIIPMSERDRKRCGPTTCSSYRRTDNRSLGAFLTILGVIFAGITIGMAVTLLLFGPHRNPLATVIADKCFQTSALAIGKVEKASTSSVTMIFPSGLRERYSYDQLTEVPCSALTTPNTASRVDDSRASSETYAQGYY